MKRGDQAIQAMPANLTKNLGLGSDHQKFDPVEISGLRGLSSTATT